MNTILLSLYILSGVLSINKLDRTQECKAVYLVFNTWWTERKTNSYTELFALFNINTALIEDNRVIQKKQFWNTAPLNLKKCSNDF